jgi:ERCC4-type nuclease
MQIVIDIREHALIEKLREIAAANPTTPITIETSALLLGDVLIKINDTNEILLYERKSFTDLLASIRDGRYEEQSHRLIHTSGMHPHNIVYILEGVFSTLRNPADKKIILSAMTSLSYFKGFSVFKTATVLETAELIWGMATKIRNEFEKGQTIPSYSLSEKSESLPPVSYSNFVKKSKRDNITPENIGEILLSQMPGISSHIATEILKHFGGSFTQLIMDIRTNPEKLDAIYLDAGIGKRRKLSSAVIQNIKAFLCN